jgi:two-component system phosphate regulon response regulator PhoB
VAENAEKPDILVDDEESICRMMSLILETDGLSARFALRAEDAIAELEARKPSLLILDWLIPGTTGRDLIAKFRAGGYEGKVLVCTAMEGDPEAGVDGVLKKPFKPEELTDAVRQLL